MERTYLMIKPDGVQRGFIGEIISRLERKGLKPVAMKFLKVTKSMAEKHYAEHKGKGFYNSLLVHITSGPVLAMVWEGEDAVAVCRNMIGKTNPKEAAPGTIRGDLGMQTGMNIIHGSDSKESAEREIPIFFSPSEILDYQETADQWIYE